MNETVYLRILDRLGLKPSRETDAEGKPGAATTSGAPTPVMQDGPDHLETESRPPGIMAGRETEWPWIISELGMRRTGPFEPCVRCGKGSWVRYGRKILCRSCAQILSRDAASVVPVMVDSPDHGDGYDLPHGETSDCRDCTPTDAALE